MFNACKCHVSAFATFVYTLIKKYETENNKQFVTTLTNCLSYDSLWSQQGDQSKTVYEE